MQPTTRQTPARQAHSGTARDHAGDHVSDPIVLDPIAGDPIVRDSLPLLAGAAAAIGGIGAVLALADIASPIRAPFTLFFLLAAPGCALAATLRGLDPLSRAVLAAGGALVVDVLVAQGMLALHMWSARGGVAVVTALSFLLFLLALVRDPG